MQDDLDTAPLSVKNLESCTLFFPKESLLLCVVLFLSPLSVISMFRHIHPHDDVPPPPHLNPHICTTTHPHDATLSHPKRPPHQHTQPHTTQCPHQALSPAYPPPTLTNMSMNKQQQDAVLEATMRYAVDQMVAAEKQLDEVCFFFIAFRSSLSSSHLLLAPPAPRGCHHLPS